MIMNILFIGIVLILFFFIIVLIWLLRKLILNKCWKPIKNLLLLIQRRLVFNSVLRAVMESYLMLSI